MHSSGSNIGGLTTFRDLKENIAEDLSCMRDELYMRCKVFACNDGSVSMNLSGCYQDSNSANILSKHNICHDHSYVSHIGSLKASKVGFLNVYNLMSKLVIPEF